MKFYSILALFSALLFGIAIGMFITAGSNTVDVIYPELSMANSVDRMELTELETGEYTSTINIVAVTNAGEGLIDSAEVELIPGKGRVLFNTNPFLEPDTQQSVETAKLIAEILTKKRIEDLDVVYTINSNATLVGGPSAGAALTIATISAILQQPIKENIAITGTIETNGTIGQVGGIPEKALAAAESGVTIFLVPTGQGLFTFYEQKSELRERRGFVYRRNFYEPVTVDLNAAFSEEYGMQLIEVKSITEAVGFMLKEKNNLQK